LAAAFTVTTVLGWFDTNDTPPIIEDEKRE